MRGGSSAYYPEGIVDVGVLLVSLFRNPLQEAAVGFLADVPLQKKRAAIPVAAVLGAFHWRPGT